MILDQIAKDTQIRVAKKKEACPLEEIREKALACENTGEFPFEKALAGKEMSFICEVKRASPSKGVIAPVFLYLQIAEEYEKAGASAISCLTEPKYFLGQDRYLR